MQNLNEELSRLKQMMGINPSNDLINEEKADRCLRIARRKYDKPSAYRSGAIVRCRQGKIWKDLKENDQDFQNKLKTYKIPYKTFNSRIKNNFIQTWKEDYGNDIKKINEMVARHLLYEIAQDLFDGVNEIEFMNESKSPINHFQMQMHLGEVILFTAPFIFVDNNHNVVPKNTNIELLDSDYETIMILREGEISEESINESFKITFEDEKNIENEIRKKYDRYLDEIKKRNDYIKAMKLVLKMADNDEQREFFNKEYGQFKDMDFTIPIRYNKFYAENKKEITDDYIRYKSNNSPTTFEYPTKPIKIDIDKYYSSLSKNELESIKKFLYIVAERVNSGTGESVNRKHVRDAFFRTPKTFQETFSEKPNGYLWRGDYTHPKDPDYDHNDKEYLSMQSFSTSKNTARSFGYNFSASNIKSYSGSFSLEKFLHYGITDIFAGIAKFGDDEGEVMFFDVTYKNKSMDEAKKTDYSKEKKSG